MKKIFAMIMLLALLLSACGEAASAPAASAPDAADVCGVPIAPETVDGAAGEALALEFAAGYGELYALINERESLRYYDSANDFAEAVPEAPAEDSSTNAEEGGYSGTNVQVAGIDEGDVVKTDGEYIYILSGYELVIVRADGSSSAVHSRTQIGEEYSEDKKENPDGSWEYRGGGKYPREIFVSGDRLLVISNASAYSEYVSADGTWDYGSDSFTDVAVYDVSDPARPALLAQLGQDGELLGSRMYGGKVYIVSRHTVWSAENEDEPESYVPALYVNESSELVEPGAICICPYGSGTDYVVVVAYDPGSAEIGAVQSVLGAGDRVYMSGGNIYVAGTVVNLEESEPRPESVYEVIDYRKSRDTSLFRFSLEHGLSLEAQGLVPGYIESQFSLDEYEGHIRLVTTRDESSYSIYTDHELGFVNYVWPEEGKSRTNGLYILSKELQIVGSVEDLAEGETVYSARFDGGMAYFCTFEQVDPLFAVDVSDPEEPVVLSALKISGFSEYLHKWGENRLFGFGYEADEENGWTQGLKMAMFDTRDKADVTAAASYVMEDCRYSEALYDQRAFFLEPEKNIIGFQGDGDYHIYGYDEESGFYRRGYLQFEDWEDKVRGMYIGGDVYIVGTQHIYILGLENMEQKAKIDI